jgi:hypothetical protein
VWPQDDGPLYRHALTEQGWDYLGPVYFAASPAVREAATHNQEANVSYPTEYVVSLHGNPLWEAIWGVVKPWDIEREPGQGYAHATGDDATRLYDAVRAALAAEGERP